MNDATGIPKWEQWYKWQKRVGDSKLVRRQTNGGDEALA